MISASLSEQSLLAKRAVRAFGYSWGQAEEAAWINHKLAQRQLPAFHALCLLLHQVNKTDLLEKHFYKGTDITTQIHANNNWLCSLSASITLLDRHTQVVQLISNGKTLQLQDVISPMLLIQPIQMLANKHSLLIQMTWANTRCMCNQTRIYTSGNLLEHIPQNVHISLANNIDTAYHWNQFVQGKPTPVPNLVWDDMVAYAYKICVPNSKTSRMGAGEDT